MGSCGLVEREVQEEGLLVRGTPANVLDRLRDKFRQDLVELPAGHHGARITQEQFGVGQAPGGRLHYQVRVLNEAERRVVGYVGAEIVVETPR